MESEFNSGNLLHKKVCALEIRKELDKTLMLAGVNIVGLAVLSIMLGNVIALAIFLGITIGFGVRAYKYKQYLETKYELVPTFKLQK